MSGEKKLATIIFQAIISVSLLLLKTNSGSIDATNARLLEDTDFVMFAENYDFEGRNLAACSSTDGSTNTTTSCTCGTATCGAGKFCDSAANDCMIAQKANCVQDSGRKKNSVTCICNTTTSCSTTNQCNKIANTCSSTQTSLANAVVTAGNAIGMMDSMETTVMTPANVSAFADKLGEIFSLTTIDAAVMNSAATKVASIFTGMLTMSDQSQLAALVIKVMTLLNKAALASTKIVNSANPTYTKTTSAFTMATELQFNFVRRLAPSQTANKWTVNVKNASINNNVILSLLGYNTMAAGVKPMIIITDETIISDSLRLYLYKKVGANTNEHTLGSHADEEITLKYNIGVKYITAAELDAEKALIDASKTTGRQIFCVQSDSIVGAAYTKGPLPTSIVKNGANDYTITCKTKVANKFFTILKKPYAAPVVKEEGLGTGALIGIIIGAVVVISAIIGVIVCKMKGKACFKKDEENQK